MYKKHLFLLLTFCIMIFGVTTAEAYDDLKIGYIAIEQNGKPIPLGFDPDKFYYEGIYITDNQPISVDVDISPDHQYTIDLDGTPFRFNESFAINDGVNNLKISIGDDTNERVYTFIINKVNIELTNVTKNSVTFTFSPFHGAQIIKIEQNENEEGYVESTLQSTIDDTSTSATVINLKEGEDYTFVFVVQGIGQSYTSREFEASTALIKFTEDMVEASKDGIIDDSLIIQSVDNIQFSNKIKEDDIELVGLPTDMEYSISRIDSHNIELFLGDVPESYRHLTGIYDIYAIVDQSVLINSNEDLKTNSFWIKLHGNGQVTLPIISTTLDINHSTRIIKNVPYLIKVNELSSLIQNIDDLELFLLNANNDEVDFATENIRLVVFDPNTNKSNEFKLEYNYNSKYITPERLPNNSYIIGKHSLKSVYIDRNILLDAIASGDGVYIKMNDNWFDLLKLNDTSSFNNSNNSVQINHSITKYNGISISD